MESTLKDMRDGASVLDMDPNSSVGGGVGDVYGEDRATEEQLVTPWAVSVASGYALLRDPHHNKGLAFTEKERDAHYLRGLLPPVVFNQELQEKKLMHSLRQCVAPLHKYMDLMELHCLPITIDVGTKNEQLLKDEFYIVLRQKRATGKEYADFLHEFMAAVKQNYGEKVLVQFEDFANHNAFELLAKYGTSHLVFNDDIQGTASVVLAGLVASLKLLGGSLADHTYLFFGAGEAGTGIAELLVLEMSKQTKPPLEENRKKTWLVDSRGLIVNSRKESLQNFKKPWPHEHGEGPPRCCEALIRTSGVGKSFTKEVIEVMASFNEGREIFASGSPFDPVEYNGNVYAPDQMTIASNIKTSLAKPEIAKDYMKSIEERFKILDKSLTGKLMADLTTMRFDGTRSMHEHIIEMTNLSAKLKNLGMTVDDYFIVQFILNSLPPQYGPFQIHYNTIKDKWQVNKLTNKLVQKEARLTQEGIKAAHLVYGAGHKARRRQTSGHKRASPKTNEANQSLEKKARKEERCKFCEKPRHFRKDCLKRREWFKKKSNPMGFEFLSTQPINPSENFLFMGNRDKAPVDAIETFCLVLDSGNHLDLC